MLDQALTQAGRSRDDIEIIVMPSNVNSDNVTMYQDIGVNRLIPMLTASSQGAVKKRIDEIAKLTDAL